MSNNYEWRGTDGYVVELFMPTVHDKGVRRFLKQELNSVKREPFVKGYSIYTVDGAFKGEGGKLYTEKTTVIRIFFDQRDLRGNNDKNYADEKLQMLVRLGSKVKDMLHELTRVSKGIEEQIWAMRTEPHVYKFVRIKNASK